MRQNLNNRTHQTSEDNAPWRVACSEKHCERESVSEDLPVLPSAYQTSRNTEPFGIVGKMFTENIGVNLSL